MTQSQRKFLTNLLQLIAIMLWSPMGKFNLQWLFGEPTPSGIQLLCIVISFVLGGLLLLLVYNLLQKED